MSRKLLRTLRRAVFAVLAAGAFRAPAFAWGPDIHSTTEAQYDSWGNQARNRSVAQSTTSVVLLSSAPSNAGLGVTDFRARVIENMGNTTLTLYGDNSTFTIYQSSAGIHLSSDSTSVLNRYTWYGQGAIYGIWNSTGTTSGGASVTEFYYKNR